MSDDKASQPITTIEGRLDQSSWVVVTIFGFCGALLFYALWTEPPKPEDKLVAFLLVVGIGLPMLVGAIYLGVLLIRSRIRADEFGLHWRSMSQWRRAAWSEVSDYYIRKGPKAQEKWIVVTLRGDVCISDFPKVKDALRTTIQQRARYADAHDWEIFQIRPQDEWPRIFSYNPNPDRDYPFVVAGMFLVFPLILWVKSASLSPLKFWTNVTATFSSLDLPLAILLGLTLLMMSSIYPLIMLAQLPRVRATRARKNQRIICDLEAISFEDNARRIRATWPEVTRFYIAPLKGWVTLDELFTVETTLGNFDFCGIQDQRVLREIIARYATHATTGKWQRLSESQDGVRTESNLLGPRTIYTYHTRMNRALLWFPTAVPFMMPFGYWLNLQVSGTRLGWDGLVMAEIFGVIAILLWILYFGVRVLHDNSGIEIRWLWRVTKLRWDEIEDLDFRNGMYYVSGRGKRIRFSPFIGGAMELKNEIERRTQKTHISASFDAQ